MYKKIYLIIATFLILGLSCSYGATQSVKSVLLKSMRLESTTIEKKTGNEIYYVWVLMDDGCFYLFRVEVVGGILEFWTPMGPDNFVGSTRNCIFREEIDSIC